MNFKTKWKIGIKIVYLHERNDLAMIQVKRAVTSSIQNVWRTTMISHGEANGVASAL